MNKQLVRDIKSIYSSALREACFRPEFEQKLAYYIQQRAPQGSVHWQKLRYEFRTVYRKCRDEQKSLQCYLKTMAQLTEVALDGRHRQTELNIATLNIQQL